MTLQKPQQSLSKLAGIASFLNSPAGSALAIPAGLALNSVGRNINSAVATAQPPMRIAGNIADEFKDSFEPGTMTDWQKLNPKKDTYAQWQALRKSKFLAPYIQSGHSGLNTKLAPGVSAETPIKLLRKMVGKWGPSQDRHYSSFKKSPSDALKVLAMEGTEETGVHRVNKALTSLLSDYDALAAEHGPYEGLNKLYDTPWAALDLRDPNAVKAYANAYGTPALHDAKKKQALLFYATKSKMFAPRWYKALLGTFNGIGTASEAVGAGLAGYGGIRSGENVAKHLKTSAANEKKVEEAPTPPNAAVNLIADLTQGANPLSTHTDELGVTFKPKSRWEEAKRVVPSVAGKAMVGAVVVPSAVRSLVEGVRGAFLEGPYAASKSRVGGMATGLLRGALIPAQSIYRAARTGRQLKGMGAGTVTPTSDELQRLGRHLKNVPIGSAEPHSDAINALIAGKNIEPNVARALHDAAFETNATTALNAALGGALSGYGGYASYARGKKTREAFERAYGTDLTPQQLAYIFNMKPEVKKEKSRV